jgi:hypothetical protein
MWIAANRDAPIALRPLAQAFPGKAGSRAGSSNVRALLARERPRQRALVPPAGIVPNAPRACGAFACEASSYEGHPAPCRNAPCARTPAPAGARTEPPAPEPNLTLRRTRK